MSAARHRAASDPDRAAAPADTPPAPVLLTEPTGIGPQCLVPGVTPIHLRDRLAWRAAAPLEPRKPQRACDHGLFDLNARLQLDLFAAPSLLPPPQPSD